MPAVSFASHTLEYPPWAIEFDPYNRGYLVVGGGGGQGQKEVPNRLTLLDISDRSKIENVAELDVVEDSPASLGLLAARDGLFALTGINSRAEQRKSGTNEHLRSFQVKFPPRTKAAKAKRSTPKKGTVSISPLGQSSLFSPTFASSSDAFQRLLRLSPVQIRPTGNKRIGAIASSLALNSEIVVFDATVASPIAKDIIHRIEGTPKDEPNDLDIFEVSENNFRLAYCTHTAIYTVDISYDFTAHKVRSAVVEPSCLYEVLSRPAKIRSLRFLSHDHILGLINKGSESELFILRIHPKGGPGDVILRRRLSKRTGTAVSLDISSLDADPTTGDKQVAVVVAAQKHDISIFTINMPGKGSPTGIKAYKDLKDTHEVPMKKVVLSTFHSPYGPADASGKPAKKQVADQYIHVASISLSNTIIVDCLPLYPKDTKKGSPRYVLDQNNAVTSIVRSGVNYFMIAFIVAISLVLAQSFLDHRAKDTGGVASIQLLPPRMRSALDAFRADTDPVKHIIHEAVVATPTRLADLVPDSVPATVQSAIIIKPDSKGGNLKAEVHDDHAAVVEDPNAKRWDELTKKQQETWKKRLVKAGQWSADEGETILKSIFFSEVAGAIGRAAMEAINA